MVRLSSSVSAPTSKLICGRETFTEDLKETKERLNMEIESLTRQLTRRERTGEETLTRARTAESSLTSLREEYKTYVSTHKSRNKELEESEKKAREEKQRLEGEYAALREGMKSMSEGWKRDLEWLKQSLSKSEKELETKSNARASLFSLHLHPQNVSLMKGNTIHSYETVVITVSALDFNLNDDDFPLDSSNRFPQELLKRDWRRTEKPQIAERAT